jgi:hypothetical protein
MSYFSPSKIPHFLFAVLRIKPKDFYMLGKCLNFTEFILVELCRNILRAVWLLSFGIITLRLEVHLVCVPIVYMFLLLIISHLCKYITVSYLVHLFICWWTFRLFPVLPWMYIHVFEYICSFMSLKKIPRNEMYK